MVKNLGKRKEKTRDKANNSKGLRVFECSRWGHFLSRVLPERGPLWDLSLTLAPELLSEYLKWHIQVSQYRKIFFISMVNYCRNIQTGGGHKQNICLAHSFEYTEATISRGGEGSPDICPFCTNWDFLIHVGKFWFYGSDSEIWALLSSHGN